MVSWYELLEEWCSIRQPDLRGDTADKAMKEQQDWILNWAWRPGTPDLFATLVFSLG